MGPEEDEMSSTLTTTCPLCGLRFPGRPLLDLHMREDHRERNLPAESHHDDSGDAGTPGDGSDGPSRGDAGLASRQADIAQEEVIAMTAKQRPHSGRAMTALRRAIGILRSPARTGRDAQPTSPGGRAELSA
jgi:hypothetical protein